ncbi:thiol:disulfide interchange protein DsbA/DsbL [Lysobacter sp. 5GHs7-4]|uniref:thiol:disulfide interchange protein DsbA/DsbL n=1 Tax=Lysobacter sp. 5GHs7-4 TaxID=2904253 RepID=UPI001E49C57B|nr:thiol:disulfide interchange protein DsbA/DsbL [Lysobacter sp. 5GHs7-4]UHQ23750.1 thiol:disulfide interchange protein DsbA/DsbL [Lysobacter sp. 5GHs7-4]
MTPRLAPSYRYPVLFAALFALAACNQQQETAAPTADVAAPSAEAAPANAVPGQPAQVEAAPEIVPAATATPPSGPAPVVGTDYVEIPGGTPYAPVAGKIEVVEVFGYTCPHCAEFEPLINSWRAKQTADVNFVPVAAPFGGYWMPYAKAFYTAESMGLVSRSHDAMFRAVHLERSMPVNGVKPVDFAEFYAKFGANKQQFESTYASFAIDAKLKRAETFLSRSGVESTPNLVVDGKYRVIGKNFDDMLRIADHLVAQERAARAGGAAAPAAEGAAAPGATPAAPAAQ